MWPLLKWCPFWAHRFTYLLCTVYTYLLTVCRSWCSQGWVGGRQHARSSWLPLIGSTCHCRTALMFVMLPGQHLVTRWWVSLSRCVLRLHCEPTRTKQWLWSIGIFSSPTKPPCLTAILRYSTWKLLWLELVLDNYFICQNCDENIRFLKINYITWYGMWILSPFSLQCLTVTMQHYSIEVLSFSFYVRQQVLLLAHISHRNSVRPSHGWISQKRCKLGYQIFTVGCLEDSSFRNRKDFK